MILLMAVVVIYIVLGILYESFTPVYYVYVEQARMALSRCRAGSRPHNASAPAPSATMEPASSK